MSGKSPIAIAGWRARLALAAMLLAPAIAVAQNAVGDGRSLDASLQRGAGGVNAAQAQPEYRARNDVVTGNVAGLGYFRGSTGYRAAGELNARQSGDSLFRFQAVSLPPLSASGSAALGNPAAASGSGAGTAGAMSVLRPLSPGSMGSAGAPASIGGLLTPRSDLSASAGAWPSRDRVITNDGRAIEVEASPLLGVRVMPIPSVMSHDANSGVTADVPGALAGALPGAHPGSGGRAGDASHPMAVVNRMDSRQFMAGSAWGTHPVFRAGPDAPAVQLGAALGQMIQTRMAGDRAAQLDQQVLRIEANLFSPLGTATVEPGRDVYLDLLTRIRRNRDISSGKLDASAEPPKEDSLGVIASAAPQASPAIPLTKPTAEQLVAAQTARQAAQRQARSLAPVTPSSPSSNSAGDPARGKDGFDETMDRRVKGPLTEFMDAIAAPTPAIPSFTAVASTRAAAMLKQAERDMIDRRYFDAEARYSMAIEMTPNNPLPRLGMVHAQIGAGMVQSAASNLRELLAAHPELAGVRCEPRLLPPVDRLDKARRQLDAMLAYSTRTDLAILLAYLGRQSGEPSLVRYGLDLAIARAPDDPMITFLTRLWLASTPQDSPGPATRPAP